MCTGSKTTLRCDARMLSSLCQIRCLRTGLDRIIRWQWWWFACSPFGRIFILWLIENTINNCAALPHEYSCMHANRCSGSGDVCVHDTKTSVGNAPAQPVCYPRTPGVCVDPRKLSTAARTFAIRLSIVYTNTLKFDTPRSQTYTHTHAHAHITHVHVCAFGLAKYAPLSGRSLNIARIVAS